MEQVKIGAIQGFDQNPCNIPKGGPIHKWDKLESLQHKVVQSAWSV